MEKNKLCLSTHVLELKKYMYWHSLLPVVILLTEEFPVATTENINILKVNSGAPGLQLLVSRSGTIIITIFVITKRNKTKTKPKNKHKKPYYYI